MIAKVFCTLLLCSVVTMIQSCIHDYPYGEGENPNKTEAALDISFSLRWDRMLHHIDFESRARNDRIYRFIIEARKNDEIFCRDVIWLSDAEFLNGNYHHRFSRKLNQAIYQIAVWFDYTPDGVSSGFKVDDLTHVSVNTEASVDAEFFQCGYASDYLDLRNKVNSMIIHEIELKHATSRFEIVATDIQQFITNQKAALNQGDSFRYQLIPADTNPLFFNIFEENIESEGDNNIYSGDIAIPFGLYPELKIAEGISFCNQEDNITFTLVVYNSARMIVTKTEPFTIPVKRGYITVVRGDFLTTPIDGSLSINHIWDGEIFIEV